MKIGLYENFHHNLYYTVVSYHWYDLYSVILHCMIHNFEIVISFVKLFSLKLFQSPKKCETHSKADFSTIIQTVSSREHRVKTISYLTRSKSNRLSHNYKLNIMNSYS